MKCEVCGSTFKTTRFKGVTALCNKHYKQMYRFGRIKTRTKSDPNEIIIIGDYAEVVLYNVDSEEVARAIIDVEDIDALSGRKWYLDDCRYAISDSKKKGELIHRTVMNAPSDKIVDHINRDSLDNRKANLRICTQRENVFNSGKRSNNVSGHTGVIYRKREKKWFSYISKDGKQYSLGYHDTKKGAIEARLKGEAEHYGEFAPNKQADA